MKNLILSTFLLTISQVIAQIPIVPGEGYHVIDQVDLLYEQDSVEVSINVYSYEMTESITKIEKGIYNNDTLFVYLYYDNLGGWFITGNRETTVKINNPSNAPTHFVIRTFFDTITSDNPVINRWFYTALDSVFLEPGENFYENDEILSSESLEYDLKVYPNPATSKINVNLNSAEIERLELFDPTGKMVKESWNKSIDNLNELDNGVYFLKIYIGSAILTEKVLVTN